MDLRERVHSLLDSILDSLNVSDIDHPEYGSLAVEIKFEKGQIILLVKERELQKNISL